MKFSFKHQILNKKERMGNGKEGLRLGNQEFWRKQRVQVKVGIDEVVL